MTEPVVEVTGDITAPLFTGGGSTDTVPYKWDVGLGGRTYMLDTKMSEGWRHKGVPLLRQQQDNSLTPSSVSLSSEGVWRSGVDSWHKGAGQNYRDRPDSNPFRFRSSKGVDPWTRYQLSLLPATDQKKSSANTNLYLVVAGSRVYVIDGQTVSYTTDPTVDSPTWTGLTGVPAATILTICSDGYYLWFADGADIYRTHTATGAATLWAAGHTVTLLRFAKGRLIGAVGNAIYSYSATGASTALTTGWTVPASFTWVDVVGSPSTKHIHAAGYIGDKSLVFAYGLKDDGTGLDAGVVAAELPDGEIVRSLGSYLGFLLIGTDAGVRFAVAGSDGSLTLGPLLSTGTAVECFEGQGPHVWFGWKNYDSTSTGLGRLSLEEFAVADNLAPAYASDLMAAAQGAVTSVVTFGGKRYFTVSGSGVWGEDTTYVSSGTIESGRITANISESKTAFGVDVRHRSIPGGTTTVALSVDGGTFATLGAALSQDGTVPAEDSGREFEVRFTITKSGSNIPVLSSWTLRYWPKAQRQTVWTIPLLLHYQVELPDGIPDSIDVAYEREVLVGHFTDGTVLTFQSAIGSASVIIDDFEWIPHHFRAPGGVVPDGTMVLTLKEVS